MGSDAIANPRISAFARDSAKKKKGSRFGKVKQNKVDVRREQWVSQVKNKGCKIDPDTHPTTVPKPMDNDVHEFEPNSTTTLSWPNKKTGPSHYCSSGHNNISVQTLQRRSNSSSFSSSEEGDIDHTYTDKCYLHNWDAMSASLPSSNNPSNTGPYKGHFRNARAWAPDDTFRPRTLPRVSGTGRPKKNVQMYSNNNNKKNCNSYSFRSSTRMTWQRTVVVSHEPEPEPEPEPSSCPICCEEFDKTDSSFRPCPCGFRLCLFCHKRILEVDARCPGCRKHYDSVHEPAFVGISGSVNDKRG